MFEEERYKESLSSFNECLQAIGSDEEHPLLRQVQMWIRKCQTMIPAPKPPAPSVRHEWFQTLDSITFTFYVKGRTPSDVCAKVVDGRNLDVTIKLDDGREFQHAFENLFATISETLQINVPSMKVEIIAAKTARAQWPALEIKGAPAAATPAPAPLAAFPKTQSDLKYPNSKGKDWNKVNLETDEEKPEGEQALQKLFRDIYANATDETKKAMVKSFTESNGTVLSTNWSEIGKEKVKWEPPEGMEAKKWDE